MALFAAGFATCLMYFRAARPPELSVNEQPAPIARAASTQPAPSASKLASVAASAQQPGSPPTPPAPDTVEPGAVEKWATVLATDQSDQNRRLAVASLRTLALSQGDEDHGIRNALRVVTDDGTEVAPAALAALAQIEEANASPR
jgi:hypothetical protein